MKVTVQATTDTPTKKCNECGRTFRTDDKDQETCPDCQRLIRLGISVSKN